jgi:hypothetical protein
MAKQQTIRAMDPFFQYGASSRVEYNAPERVHDHGANVHGAQGDAAHCVVAATLQDNVCPAEYQGLTMYAVPERVPASVSRS